MDQPLAVKDDWQGLVEFWWGRFGSDEVYFSKLFDEANQVEGLNIPCYGDEEKGRRQSFGAQMKKKRESVFSVEERSVAITPGEKGAGGSKTWWLQPVDGLPGKPASSGRSDKSERTLPLPTIPEGTSKSTIHTNSTTSTTSTTNEAEQRISFSSMTDGAVAQD